MDAKTLTEGQISKLEAMGFSRWTKNGKDRLYVNASALGLECEYYKTGNICNAWWNGEKTSNSEGARMRNAKTYIDIPTGAVYSDNANLKDSASRKLAAVTEENGR